MWKNVFKNCLLLTRNIKIIQPKNFLIYSAHKKEENCCPLTKYSPLLHISEKNTVRYCLEIEFVWIGTVELGVGGQGRKIKNTWTATDLMHLLFDILRENVKKNGLKQYLPIKSLLEQWTCKCNVNQHGNPKPYYLHPIQNPFLATDHLSVKNFPYTYHPSFHVIVSHHITVCSFFSMQSTGWAPFCKAGSFKSK